MAIFRNIFSWFLRSSRSRVKVDAREQLSRFLANNNYFTASTGRVKQAGFLPPKHRNEISAFRTTHLNERTIWDLATKYVDQPTEGRLMKARADLLAGSAIDSGLEVFCDGTPHSTHSIITGWPTDKDERKAIALDLAGASTLVVRG